MCIRDSVSYDARGRMRTDSFMQYKIPTRMDVPDVRVEFMPSYEPTGPFGAKSIGEVVINTPSPAIASAVAHATGNYVRTLPITPEKALHGDPTEAPAPMSPCLLYTSTDAPEELTSPSETTPEPPEPKLSTCLLYTSTF